MGKISDSKLLKKQIPILKGLKIFVIIFVLFMFFVKLAVIPFGSDSHEVLRINSSDEAKAINAIKQNLSNKDINPRAFFNYGYVDKEIWLVVLSALKMCGFELSDRLLILVGRYLMSIYWLLIVALSVMISKELYKEEIPALAVAVITASSCVYTTWAITIHPDLLQIVFLLISFYFCILFLRGKSHFLIYIAAFFCGISSGTKYSGIFFLPVIIVLYLIKKFDIKQLLLLLVMFCLGFIIFNPYVLLEHQEFIKDLRYESRHVSMGHTGAEPKNPFQWFGKLFGTPVLGKLSMPFIILALISVFLEGILYVQAKFRNFQKMRKNYILSVKIVLFIYCTLFFIMLMIKFRMRAPRFLLPILPFLIILECGELHKILNWIASKLKPAKILIIPIYVVIIILISNPLLQLSLDDLLNRTDIYKSDYYKMGVWMLQNLNHDNTVVADSYSYIPKNSFKNYIIAGGGVRESLINKYNPDILVINKKLTGRWVWKSKGTTYTEGKFIIGKARRSKNYFDFHKKMVEGKFGYEVINENGEVVVFKRNLKYFDDSKEILR